MVDRKRVVLVGSSILMDGVAVSLAETGMRGLERIEMEVNDMRERLKALNPDLIVFELDHPSGQAINALLQSDCQLMLIGFDMDSCLAIVLNSHQHVMQSMADLCRLVQDQLQSVICPEKEGICE